MSYKVIIEDPTGRGVCHQIQVPPGHTAVVHLYNYSIVVTPKGTALMLPKELRDTIANMTTDEDRIISVSPDVPKEQTEAAMQEVLDISLDFYPKGEIEYREESSNE